MKFFSKESLMILDKICDKDIRKQLMSSLDNIYETKSLVDK